MKIFKYLSAALAAASLFIIVNAVFLRKPTPPPSYTIPGFSSESVKIKSDIFEQPLFKDLSPIEKISLPEEFGRENPFLPY